MKIRLYALLAGLAIVLAGPAAAKPVHHHAKAAHRNHIDRQYAQSYYDYRSASSVREEFIDTPGGRWMSASREDYFGDAGDYRERQGGLVVENLRGDFTGGVGYGTDGDAASFVDGFGQTHFFVGSFRRMPHRPGHFGPMPGPRFGQGFHRGF